MRRVEIACDHAQRELTFMRGSLREATRLYSRNTLQRPQLIEVLRLEVRGLSDIASTQIDVCGK